jgi:hypothetical protein
VFAVFKTWGKKTGFGGDEEPAYTRGQTVDLPLAHVEQWFPNGAWREFMVHLIGRDGRIDEDELRRYAEHVAPRRERKAA